MEHNKLGVNKITSTKKSKKDAQHIVPKVYLKHWKIAEDENFVYGIDFSNKYKKGIQKFGLNDKVFIKKKYYNNPSFDNPYIIEEILGVEIEPTYEKIMAEVNSETNLSLDVREKIMLWLYISDIRSQHTRNNVKRVADFIYKLTARINGQTLSPEMENTIEQHTSQIAKNTQLNAFSSEGQLKTLLPLVVSTLNAKHWRILKSMSQFGFWTNDNPGFSPNIDERFAKDFPYHPTMEMNANSIIF